jgi:DNA polymerase III delta prime subunit
MSSNISTLFVLNPLHTGLHKQEVLHFLELPDTQHPDLHFVNQEDEALQIEDVRRLTQEMTLQPYQTSKSTFIIFQIDKASAPAQNALLKSLEEPPAHVQIFLTTHRVEQVLPTIQSRCVIQLIGAPTLIDDEKIKEKELIHQLFQSTLEGSYSDIFGLSEKYKDRAEALTFMQGLINILHHQNQEKPLPKNIHALRAALTTQDMIEKNVNVRLALEDFFLRLKSG